MSAVLGTHTHVQTAESRVLPNGTGYISDAGMTGPVDSVIGMRREIILERFWTRLPDLQSGRPEYPVAGSIADDRPRRALPGDAGAAGGIKS